MARSYSDVLNGKFGDEIVAPVAALSFIFGSGVRLLDDTDDREERRIVVYPCIADAEMIEAAQGLMCALVWSLNSLDGVTAIPLLTKIPSAEWMPEDSLFTPDSFTLEDLGEDTILTTRLARESSAFSFVLNASTDLEDIDDLVIDLKADNEETLYRLVLNSTATIATWLGANESDLNKVTLPPDFRLCDWFEAAFAWHRAALHDATLEKPLDFASSALQRFMAASHEPALTGMLVKGTALTVVWFEQVDAAALCEAIKALPHWQEGAGAVARALVELGETRRALELLETSVESAPEFPLNWLVLARLYAAFQQPALSIQALQIALEKHQQYAPLLMQYGDALMSYADQGISLEEVIFIEENLEPAAAFEAIAAYSDAARLLDGEQQAMAYVKLITALARYQPDQIWRAFDDLTIADSTGTYTELAINVVASQEDIDHAIGSLEKAVQANPNSAHLWRNLAYGQYLSGGDEAALTAIDEALRLVSDTRLRGEYELLAVFAQDVTVEAELAEIADSLSVKSAVTDRTLELLEWLVTEAPHYIEGYLLLGRAYDANGESGTALEVLLDAEQNLGADAEIYVAIIDLLLASGEEAVAIDYVTKALEAFPRHIPLLARAALVTDALGDRDSAKTFLRQAHNIVPYHKEIMRVAGMFSEDEAD